MVRFLEDQKITDSEHNISGSSGFRSGYPVYCIYIPTGMNADFEVQLLEKLKRFGEGMGKNLFVGPWDVGDPSYIWLLKKLDLKRRPAIILTDSNSPDKNSFMIILDDIKLIKDLDTLTEILPSLIDFILKGEKKDAIKMHIKTRRELKLNSLLDHFNSAMEKVKVTFSMNGITVESA